MWGLVGPPEPVIAPASASLFIIPKTDEESFFRKYSLPRIANSSRKHVNNEIGLRGRNQDRSFYYNFVQRHLLRYGHKALRALAEIMVHKFTMDYGHTPLSGRVPVAASSTKMLNKSNKRRRIYVASTKMAFPHCWRH